MQKLIIEKTKSTPYIEFNYEQKKIMITGQSYPENAFNFYEPLSRWIDEYFAQDPPDLSVELSIPYINTSSSKCLMDILDKLEEAHLQGINIKLKWYCNEENESELECAEEFLEDLTFDYTIVAYPEKSV